MATIKPILDKVVVEVRKSGEMSRGGIVLAGKTEDDTLEATVLARGPGGLIDGREVKMYLNAGDVVLIPKNFGNKVKLDGKEFIILKQEDILAMLA